MAFITLFTPADVRGHHAFAAEFDAARTVTVKGVISVVEWINPHSWVHLDVIMDDGTSVPWMFEGGSPKSLQRRGLSAELLKPGTTVIIQGYRSKAPHCDPTCRGSGHHVIFEDGRKIYMASSGSGAPE